MKLIEPSVELITQAPGIEGIYKHIEKVGRVCYKSEDKITEDSAEPFVNRMIKSRHLAMVEHGTVYMEGAPEVDDIKFWQVANSPYSKVVCDKESSKLYVTTNLRVLVENNAMNLLDKFMCEPTEHHIKRITMMFTTSRAIANEFVRHRVFSFAQESTRYCNYSKDKFGKELIFIKPVWSDAVDGNYGTLAEPNDIQFKACNGNIYNREFINELINAEFRYMNILNAGYTPQQAREVLPLALKTELAMTGFEDDYEHFFDLRYRGTTGSPHPDALQVAKMAHDLILDKLGKDL